MGRTSVTCKCGMGIDQSPCPACGHVICEHEHLSIVGYEGASQDYDIVIGEWIESSEPTGIGYTESATCKECELEISPKLLKELTGLVMYRAKFKERKR